MKTNKQLDRVAKNKTKVIKRKPSQSKGFHMMGYVNELSVKEYSTSPDVPVLNPL